MTNTGCPIHRWVPHPYRVLCGMGGMRGAPSIALGAPSIPRSLRNGWDAGCPIHHWVPHPCRVLCGMGGMPGAPPITGCPIHAAFFAEWVGCRCLFSFVIPAGNLLLNFLLVIQAQPHRGRHSGAAPQRSSFWRSPTEVVILAQPESPSLSLLLLLAFRREHGASAPRIRPSI